MEVPTKYEASKTLVPRNPNLVKLHAGFLFIEINRRRAALQKKRPEAKVISLGPGDTTEPIHASTCSAMELKARALSSKDGYTGYGLEKGELPLRSAIARKLYAGLNVKEEEIFISDGAKSDIARLQLLFGPRVSVAVQDPSFPVYADTSVIVGQTGSFLSNSQQYGNIEYMKCTPENNFFPDLSSISRKDIIFFCSPSNPTGVAATRAQLEELVTYATKNGSIIVFDSAYSPYISDDCPKSIYEIPGARRVAIEISSFSKYAGFTGVRLGWSVVPDELLYSNGFPVIKDFERLVCTCFNGASNIAQAGGLACLSPEGWEGVREMVAFYKENARLLLEAFTSFGFGTYGGVNAPYMWVHFPGKNSWDVFDEILEKANIVTSPGSGFGPAGEGFLRISAYCHREDVLEAIKRLRALFQPKNVEGQTKA